MAAPVQIQKEANQNYASVVFPADIDRDMAKQIQDDILAYVKNSPCHVLVDMHRVNFISSTGIAILMNIQDQLEDQSCQMIIHSISKEALGIFNLLGVLPLFTNVTNREEAVQVARGG